ncbi:MAG: hypothetical protein AAGF71_09110 [Pseudomonadota bacterium]
MSDNSTKAAIAAALGTTALTMSSGVQALPLAEDVTTKRTELAQRLAALAGSEDEVTVPLGDGRVAQWNNWNNAWMNHNWLNWQNI